MTIFTSLLKKDSTHLGYLVHSTENHQEAALIVPTRQHKYEFKYCICSDCSWPDTVEMTQGGRQLFTVRDVYHLDDESELGKFARSYNGTTDPSTLLNEPLFKVAFQAVKLERLTNRQQWRARELTEFDKTRAENTESTKRWLSQRVVEKTVEVEKLLAEIESVKVRLANVEEEFEAERQKLVDDAQSIATELAELQKNGS